VLCHLTLRCDRREIPHLPLLEELLPTCNYTLHAVNVSPCTDRALLRRSGTIAADSGFPCSRPGHRGIGPWRSAAGSPALRYHFVRDPNLGLGLVLAAAKLAHPEVEAARTEAEAPPAEPAQAVASREDRHGGDAAPPTKTTTTTPKEKKRPHQLISD
jgi:hypothetical protein